MTIEELCRRSYDNAEAKGWHERTRSLGEVTALFHSEVSEALECHRDPDHQPGETWFSDGSKPEGVVVELADLLIRIADASIELSLPVANCLYNTSIPMLGHGAKDAISYNGHSVRDFLDMLSVLHIFLSKAFDAGFEEESGHAVTHKLAQSMNMVGIICRIQGWDLEKALIAKLEYNETRPHRHGGKRA